jgi:DNA (cytosine-5)-methyltransferase 1
MTLRLADFFCGVGGIRLGFQQASEQFKCVFSNDIDKHTVETYELNFPEHKVTCESISDLEIKSIPDFDIFLGGFPCQPFSIAGKRQGFTDDRGNLFFSIIKILKEKRPKAFFLENVKNLKGHDQGNTYERIKKELCSLGYTFKTKILNSTQYGNTPQNRERIFLIGFLDRKHTVEFRFPKQLVLTVKLTSLLERNPRTKYYYTPSSKIFPMLSTEVLKDVSTGQVYQFRRKYVRANMSGVCPTLTANMGGGGHNVPIIKDSVGIRKLTPRECFNLQTFPSRFKLPELADSHLYKQAGNSVTVRVVKRIAQEILRVLSQE